MITVSTITIECATTSTPTGEFTAIAAGFAHSCGIRTDKTATCWGNNEYEQI